jgi:drug/metabolite transporter (DMT)-like permease
MFDLLQTWPWWAFAIIAMFCSTTYGAILKIADKSSHASLLSMVFTLCSTILMGGAVLYSQHTGMDLHYSIAGLAMAACAGAGFCLVDIQTVAMFRSGAPISLGISVIRASVAATGAITGMILFHETLDLLKVIGIICASIGIFLLCYRKQDDKTAGT